MVTELQKKMGGWLVELVAPALIMIMTGSLAFFLLDFGYDGPFFNRAKWVIGCFIFASVLISRISITEGYERAYFYGFLLAIATFVVLGFLTQIPILIRAITIGTIWWFNSKLVWDCTLIRNSNDSSDRGLLTRFGFGAKSNKEKSEGEDAGDHDSILGTTDEDTANDKKNRKVDAWTSRFFSRKKSANTPGVWVLILSVAALPFFGFGQTMMVNEATRQRSFFYFCCYLAAGLALLVTTAMMGLQRYLARRNAKMPNAVAIGWVGSGAAMIVIILISAWMLPRPHSEVSFAENPFKVKGKSDLGSSRNSFGNEGKDDGRSGNQDNQSKNESGSGKSDKKGGSKDGSKNKGGSGKGQKKSSGKSKSTDRKNNQGNKSGEKSGKSKQSDNSGKGKSKDNSKSGSKSNQNQQNDKSKNENRNEQNEQNEMDDQQQGRSKNDRSNPKSGSKNRNAENRSANKDQNRSQSKSGSSNSNDSSQQGKNNNNSNSSLKNKQQSSFKIPSLPNIAWIVQLIFWIIVACIALFFAWRYRQQIWTSFLKFIEDVKNFWANLFGKKKQNQDSTESLVENFSPAKPKKPFAAFANPFQNGNLNELSMAEIVKYSYEALEAWGRERGIEMDLDQTPHEYVVKLAKVDRPVARSAKKLADFYCSIAFAKEQLDPKMVDSDLQELWLQLYQLPKQVDLQPA